MSNRREITIRPHDEQLKLPICGIFCAAADKLAQNFIMPSSGHRLFEVLPPVAISVPILRT
jgi:hypothetical protein